MEAGVRREKNLFKASALAVAVIYSLSWAIHTYIHTIIYLGTLASTTRADFHEGREFRKKTYYTDKRFKIIQEQRKMNYYINR